ncbi:MAG: glycoside hydrolase family 68 protein [Sphingobium sp.]
MSEISSWTCEHVKAAGLTGDSAPLIEVADIAPVADGLVLWDAWPIQGRDGFPVQLAGGDEIWMALASPRFDDPDERHGHARIHLFRRNGQSWCHVGPAMPNGFSPGSREWSGSAIYDPEDSVVTLYFTAAGQRGEAELTFEQRLFSAQATLEADGICSGWRNLTELVTINPVMYMETTAGGQIGTIKAFRDPSYFRDPMSGRHYQFFAASIAGSASAYNGAVGVAVAPADQPDNWQLMPPIVSADGVNNELERPHVIRHDGHYYLFWSTQAHVFNPEGPTGPTGLYGMVSSRLDGDWRPLNGSGLVFANPQEAPAQAYSWMVLPDLSVTSFADNWGGGSRRRFGGCFAPFLQLRLNGEYTRLEPAYHAG